MKEKQEAKERMKNTRADYTPEKKREERVKDAEMKKRVRANYTPEKKQEKRAKDAEKKKKERAIATEEENTEFEQIVDKVDHSILDSTAFKIVQKKVEEAFAQGAEFVCDICDQMCFKRNTRKLNSDNYSKDDNQKMLFQSICRNKSEHICLSCHSKITRSEILLMQSEMWV